MRHVITILYYIINISFWVKFGQLYVLSAFLNNNFSDYNQVFTANQLFWVRIVGISVPPDGMMKARGEPDDVGPVRTSDRMMGHICKHVSVSPLGAIFVNSPNVILV